MPTPFTRKFLEQDLAFVERQLKERTDPHDTMRLMWEQRRDALREELGEKIRPESRARIALVFEGMPVIGNEEIRLDFATKALDNYQSVVTSIFAERAGVELGERGKLPSRLASKLFIRDMVRGSVGFLLEEARTSQYDLLPTPLQEAVKETTDILRDLSNRDSAVFEERIKRLSPRTVSAVKRMSKVLHDAGAETKLVSDLEEFSLDYSNTASLYSRLSDVDLSDESGEQGCYSDYSPSDSNTSFGSVKLYLMDPFRRYSIQNI
jgi:hypothetical protein